VATQDDSEPLRRIFQLPPPERGVGYGTPPPVERLADLAWAPDGRHLLVATHLCDSGGPSRARLLLLDTGAAPLPPRELVTMPAEPVPGSYSWSAAGDSGGGGSGHDGGGGCFLGICDPSSWLQGVVKTIVGDFLQQLISGITSAVASFLNSLNFTTRTPPELSYQQKLVGEYEGVMRAVANGLLPVASVP
jgi:hypothetical protein